MTDEKLEAIIGNCLRVGVLGSATIVMVGGILYLIQHHAEKRELYSVSHGAQRLANAARNITFSGATRGGFYDSIWTGPAHRDSDCPRCAGNAWLLFGTAIDFMLPSASWCLPFSSSASRMRCGPSADEGAPSVFDESVVTLFKDGLPLWFQCLHYPGTRSSPNIPGTQKREWKCEAEICRYD